jgi:hypothetical protein
MDHELLADLTGGLADAEIEQTMPSLEAYHVAVESAGFIYVDSVSQGVAIGDVIYSNVVSTTAAYS